MSCVQNYQSHFAAEFAAESSAALDLNLRTLQLTHNEAVHCVLLEDWRADVKLEFEN